MIKEFGLRLKRAYLKLRWKRAVKNWFKHDPRLLNKLRTQLNKTNNELRQIRSRKKVL